MDAAELGELALGFAAALWFKGRMPPREGDARGTNLAHSTPICSTPICSICCLRASLDDGLPRAVINAGRSRFFFRGKLPYRFQRTGGGDLRRAAESRDRARRG